MFDKTLFKSGETIAVALSGGMDSVCLLHILLDNKNSLGITVKAVNVEHGIRGESSKRDSEFVIKLCKKLGVELKCYTVNAPEYASKNALSMETAARVLRYECFDNALIGGFCDKIATAHHQNDDVETVLFNLFRGSGLSGVSGIKKVSQSGRIIRPLLNVSRDTLLDLATKNNYEYVTDQTNFDDAPTRNFLRLNVIPLIKTRFTDFEQAVSRFSQIASEEDEYLDKKACSLIIKEQNALLIPDEQDLVLLKRAALIMLKANGFTVDYQKQHLDALVNLATLQTGAYINLKNNLIARKSYSKIVFERQTQNTNRLFCIPFSIGTFTVGNYLLTIKPAEKRENTGLFFDLDKLPKNAQIRFKRTGDTIVSFGGKRKTLKKYLTDKKIEARLSGGFPLIACDEKVYAVCPVDISDEIKIDENTTRFIQIICSEKGEDNNV